MGKRRKSRSGGAEKSAEIVALIRTQIENLRPKLLNLTRRNPLISTQFTARSNSHIRVVDELPDQLLFALSQGEEMTFAALPPLEEDPKDEKNENFRNSLAAAYLTDTQYIETMERIDRDEEDALEKSRKTERQLKDRVRELLEMPPRQTGRDISLAVHARNNGISPSYDLPAPKEKNDDGRHEDDLIQTLLLPDVLNRTMDRLMTKCRTWEQETGINVFHAAFGFLEWGEDAKKSVSPLVLLKVKARRQKTIEGPKYRVKSADEEAVSNGVLAESLRVNHALEIPPYEGGSIEEYIDKIDKLAPAGLNWRVRRFVAFGVFPSASMSIYEDLAPDNLVENEVIDQVLAGAPGGGDSPFADEYHVDDPEIEKKVPHLITEADSSQFSVLVDIADGKNTAVEGPPGTGKSQTILNTIASALSEGKKVLFVAEKMAALEVVKSRLEAMELGPFLLPLQAARSTREQVIQSLRERVEMQPPREPKDLESKRDAFSKARKEIGEYIAIISSPHKNTDLTVYEVIGRSMKTARHLENAPKPLQTPSPDLGGSIKLNMDEIKEACGSLTRAWAAAKDCENSWRGLSIAGADPFTINAILDECGNAASIFDDIAKISEQFARLGAPETFEDADIAETRELGGYFLQGADDIDVGLLENLIEGRALEEAKEFFSQCQSARPGSAELKEHLVSELNAEALKRLSELNAVVKECGFDSLNLEKINVHVEQKRSGLRKTEANLEALNKFLNVVTDLRYAKIQDFIDARSLIEMTKEKALSLRSEMILAPKNRLGLETSIILAEKFQTHAQELGDIFNLAHLPDSREIFDAAKTVGTAGVFAFLFPKYHSAKRLYLYISKQGVFDKANAAGQLRNLLSWKSQTEKFRENSSMRRLFGANFEIEQIDCAAFRKLSEYVKQVERRFPVIDHGAMRDFLLTGDIAHLSALPNLASVECGADIDHLRQIIDDEKTSLSRLEKGMNLVAHNAEVFSFPENISADSLNSLTGKLEHYLTEKARAEENSSMRRILGGQFAGIESHIGNIESEIELAEKFKTVSASTGELILASHKQGALHTLLETAESLALKHGEAQRLADDIFEKTNVVFFEGEKSYSGIAESLKHAANDRQGFMAHAEYCLALSAFKETGMNWIVDALHSENHGLENLWLVTEAVIYRSMAMDIYRTHNELKKFSGKNLNILRARLAELDRLILRLNRRMLRTRIYEMAQPPAGNGIGRVGSYTERALINHEIEKKKRHISPRQLIERAGNALQELKPCWMMSPLAVANYVQKDKLDFDLCIIDEASQMPPENALGALMRSKQCMIVGDTNQLPPTSFFKTMIEDSDTDEDETVLDESILERANSAFRPRRRLRWHYRSRHSGLIQFSNHYIYDKNLIVFPSPFEKAENTGVSLIPVKGIYSGSVNPREAEVVAEAVIKFMREQPNRSLGVVTMNQKQCDLLNEQLLRAIDESPKATEYVRHWKEHKDGLEEYFVKNLENVQGDERDVIFISTVYGPAEENGPVANRFGPINGAAGKRRLNVLFSRAKHQIVTFSSMSAADIRSDAAKNAGANLLKNWLQYSATGILESGVTTSRQPDSAFEEYVIEQIEAMGCEAVPQVGVHGYFIDIGVNHPNWPHGFILGVECDGASYHSSRSARDRDRLRQEVLEGLGWHFHRIWSTDWFNDPHSEAEKLRDRIEERLRELSEQRPDLAEQSLPTESVAATELLAEPIAEAEPSAEPQLEMPVFASVESTIGVNIGDTVLVRYLDKDESTLQFTISKDQDDQNSGIVNFGKPLAKAVLNAEEGEEVEILIGSYLRRAVIDKITRP